MDIRISGHQVETGDALRTHVTDRLQGIAEKYFARTMSSEVTFGKGPHDIGFKCDIVMHVTRGLVMKGRHDAQDAHLSFDGAAAKIEKQLRRYSRRLKDRNAGQAIELAEAGAYDAGYTLFAEQVDEDEAGRCAPDHRRNPRGYSRCQRVRCGDDARPAQYSRPAVQEFGHRIV
ncbi:ribosomal subunit interface protein [Sphingomonas sp. SORGH_AS 879]|nr:ribosomal subunit interface protein [Sphingomonas sp. SORGH_AS_0879]